MASWAEERMGAHPGVSAAAAHYGPGEEGREAELRVGVVLKAGGVGGTEEVRPEKEALKRLYLARRRLVCDLAILSTSHSVQLD